MSACESIRFRLVVARESMYSGRMSHEMKFGAVKLPAWHAYSPLAKLSMLLPRNEDQSW